jgi:hypothetical protein
MPFPSGLKTRRAQDYVNVSLGRDTKFLLLIAIMRLKVTIAWRNPSKRLLSHEKSYGVA